MSLPTASDCGNRLGAGAATAGVQQAASTAGGAQQAAPLGAGTQQAAST